MTLLMWEEEGGELLPERVWPGPEHHGTKNFLRLNESRSTLVMSNRRHALATGLIRGD